MITSPSFSALLFTYSILFHPIPYRFQKCIRIIPTAQTKAQWFPVVPSGSLWFCALHAEAVTHTLAAPDVSGIAGEG